MKNPTPSTILYERWKNSKGRRYHERAYSVGSSYEGRLIPPETSVVHEYFFPDTGHQKIEGYTTIFGNGESDPVFTTKDTFKAVYAPGSNIDLKAELGNPNGISSNPEIMPRRGLRIVKKRPEPED